jgi:molybdopterin-containing oxidoreductase family membrane subunit
MDSRILPRGQQRTTFGKFLLWLLPWGALLGVALYAGYLCLAYGLNQTNMDNRFAFGLWIYLDLTIIALGAGAFFTGFLLYILKMKELQAVINSAVVIGFICYSGAVAVLMAEVTFCITCDLSVLAVEYTPVILRNREFKKIPSFLVFEFEMHKIMFVLAAVGTFLSFFHQGSLGGLYGVLSARPFAFREAIGIWPTTFFLFIISAAAAGPSFILLTTWLASLITRKQLVRREVYSTLGRVSGTILVVYVLLKAVDSLIWINTTAPGKGFLAFDFYRGDGMGPWILLTEIILFGLVPALILLNRKRREKMPWLLSAAALACMGIIVNRYVLTIQTLALPTLPFDRVLSYTPSWQEVALFLGVIAFGMLLYSVSFRYLRLFPQERELMNS